MSVLAKKLKEAREQNKIKLDDLAVVTKISSRILLNLESGNFSKLPAPVYIRGILKVYAENFNLDESELMIAYFEETKGVEQETTEINYKDRKMNFSPKYLNYIFLSLFLLFIAGYLFYQFNSLNSAPKIFVEPGSDFITAADTLIFKGKIRPSDAKFTINNQQIIISEAGEFKQEFFLRHGSNIFVLAAINKYGKKTEVVRKVLRE